MRNPEKAKVDIKPQASSKEKERTDDTENIYRNRTMNEITEGDVGQTLKVAGWVENIRDHGGVSFIDSGYVWRAPGSNERHITS